MRLDSQISKRLPIRSSGWAFHTKIAVGLIVTGLLVYPDYIFGSKTLLYTEFGSDSLHIFYPFYILLSDYIRDVGVLSWSFRVGMGQNLFPYFGNLLLAPVVWLPKAAIAKALVYQNLLYVVVAGMLFARFLADRGLRFGSCFLGALLLSFSAYMCAGSCWYFHAYEVVCFTFLLLASEQAVTHGRWLYLTMAVVVVGLLGSFHLYLCALFLCFYVPFRFIERYSLQPLLLLRTCVVLALVALLGVGLGAILTMDNFYALVNSPRGSGLTSMAGRLSSSSVFGLDTNYLLYISEVLRPFANDMVGTEDDFRGWYNYFEAPMTYSGLLCLLIFPQVFVGATRRHRTLYAFFSGVILLLTVFPWFRYLFWAFQGEYFRAFSLFSIFGIVTLSMTAFSRYIEGRRFNLWILAVTTLILVGVLYLPFSDLQTAINRSLRVPVIIFLLAYTVLLATGQFMQKQRIVAWTIIIVSVTELIYLDRTTISARHSITKEQLNERVGYNDWTVEAIQDINSWDRTFFRITKTWGSSPSHSFPSLNDGMVFGYYGTTSHSSFNNVNYTKFLIALDVMSYGEIDSTTHWSLGLVQYPLLSTFACEKYVLTREPVRYQTEDSYEFIRRHGNTYLFRNKMFLPLGLTFSRYLSESTFLQLPTWAKPQALLRAVVLPDTATADQSGLPQLTLDELKEEMYGSTLPDIIAERRNSACNIRSFSQTRIDGSVHLDAKSIIVFQTPFDPGWQARQDGRVTPVLKVDVGLLGVALDGGDHNVELSYTPPFLASATIVSLASLSILIVGRWRWPRIRSPK